MSVLHSPRQVALLALSVVAASLVVRLLWPADLPVPKLVTGTDHGWSLSQAVAIDSDDALSVIASRRLFGAPALPVGLPGLPGAAAEQAPLTPPDWRLLAVLPTGQEPSLLISQAGSPLPLTLKIGDKLPGGARILSISNDQIGLFLHGRKAFLSTYTQ